MVKKIWAFIRWNFSRMKWHDYAWILGCGMVGAGWETEGAVFYGGVLIMLSIIFGGLIKLQWDRWKAEREDLFETIKDSK